MGKALDIALQSEWTELGTYRQWTETPWERVPILADSQAVIKGLQHTDPGQQKWLARYIIRRAE